MIDRWADRFLLCDLPRPGNLCYSPLGQLFPSFSELHWCLTLNLLFAIPTVSPQCGKHSSTRRCLTWSGAEREFLMIPNHPESIVRHLSSLPPSPHTTQLSSSRAPFHSVTWQWKMPKYISKFPLEGLQATLAENRLTRWFLRLLILWSPTYHKNLSWFLRFNKTCSAYRDI